MSSQIFLIGGDGEWKAERDPLTGNRSESWRVELLNLKDTSLGRLDGVKGGSFNFNVYATIRGGGSIDYAGAKVDWSKHRLQPWHRIESAGKVIEWPLGVFIPAAPGTDYSDTGATQSIELYDKTHILDEDKMPETYSVVAGAVVTLAIRSLLASIGETKIALTDSDEVLATSMVWDAGTSKLRIINDLLDSINYFSLWVDGYGTFRADPYQRPADRLKKFGFIDDERSIYSPDFNHDFDTFNVPNRVICIGQSDGETPADVVTVENTDPNSPYSIPSRGRPITRVEENVEATSFEILTSIATRFLTDGQNVGSTFNIKHAPIQLDFNDAVGFRRDKEGIDVMATVETISYSMEVGALCQTKIREVQR